MIRRKTIQYSIILDAVRKMKRHVTADEVFDEAVKTYPNIGRGTVYRNLQKLCDSGDLRKVEVPEGADYYDAVLTPHYHIRCVKCGSMFDVDMPHLDGLEESVKDLHGFSDISHDIMFKGICAWCRAKK